MIGRRNTTARLEAAITANADDLLRYLERRVDPRADAADVLSDALLNAWRKRASLPDDDAAARPWLFAFARNAMLNAQRRTWRRTAAVDALRDYIARQPDPLPTEDALAIREAVRQLPTDERELIELVHWDGFSLVDAAAILGIPASTARTRHATAKDRLRTALLDASTVPTTS